MKVTLVGTATLDRPIERKALLLIEMTDLHTYTSYHSMNNHSSKLIGIHNIINKCWIFWQKKKKKVSQVQTHHEVISLYHLHHTMSARQYPMQVSYDTITYDTKP